MAVMDVESGRLLKYRQLVKHPRLNKRWSRTLANKFGRLTNRVGCRIKGTNTIKFVRASNAPSESRRDITYGQFVCTVRPEKNRTRFVVGDGRIDHSGKVGTPTVEMLVTKLLFNSVVPTKGAKFMTVDISILPPDSAGMARIRAHQPT